MDGYKLICRGRSDVGTWCELCGKAVTEYALIRRAGRFAPVIRVGSACQKKLKFV